MTAESTNAADSSRPPPWINYLIALTFAAQALMIGTILSTAPILIFVEYGMALTDVGYIFAGGRREQHPAAPAAARAPVPCRTARAQGACGRQRGWVAGKFFLLC